VKVEYKHMAEAEDRWNRSVWLGLGKQEAHIGAHVGHMELISAESKQRKGWVRELGIAC